MSERVRIRFEPAGTSVEVERSTPLQEILFRYGVEFPCGGAGACRGCRVRVLVGDLPPLRDDRELLGAEEIAAGWRLACRHRAAGNLTLAVEQWETVILADDTPFAFTPREGLGMAVDLGTTTLAVQLLDLRTGQVLGVRSDLNPQASRGGDIMARIQFGLQEEGRQELTAAARRAIGEMAADLVAGVGGAALAEVTVVGNTAMHHLFCGIDPAPLAYFPFEPSQDGEQVFAAASLGWRLPGDPPVRFLPCLGGFVGSDVLAGVLATRLHRSERPAALVDLGTNGEIVVGTRERLLCASTAAGPAFEGARIAMGMRAATGAISEVGAHEGRLRCRVIGGGAPRGICGSGLVDAVAAGLDAGVIGPDGLLAGGRDKWVLKAPVTLTQRDIRELQLAKGAIAAGMRVLLNRLGLGLEDLSVVYLAGAFGNYMNRASAYRIGLLDVPPERVRPSGNTALLGAKLALFAPAGDTDEIAAIRRCVEHVPLAADPVFMESYVGAMAFPRERGGGLAPQE